ncbi:MAG TPA: rhomboid family intramembrane serine protease [Candidatus Obscuribacterales bacterium]
MTSQFSLWLYPLLVFAVFACTLRSRLGLRWAWGFLLQILFIGFAAAYGLTIGPDWLFAFIGWGLFFVFIVIPRVLLSRLEHAISVLDARQAARYSRQLRWFFWGEPGDFWHDIVVANTYFMQRKMEEATAVLNKWEQKQIPKIVRDTVATYKLTGHAILGDWQGIVDQYEEACTASLSESQRASAAAGLFTAKDLQRHFSSTVPHRLSLSASRAYLELGEFEKGTQALENATLPESRLSAKAAGVTLLPFFCLLGALPQVKTLLKISQAGKQTLPEYTRIYWLARCYAAMGKEDQARELFLKCKELASGGPDSWRLRIDTQLARLDEGSVPPLPEAHEDYVRRAWAIFEKMVFVQDVIAPNRASPVVSGLIGVILVAHVASAFSGTLHGVAIDFGSVQQQLVLEGQYWRLVTYMFLHAHLSHVFMNVLMLYWFGRVAENIFGTARFLTVFFVSGILSGVSHMLLSTDAAVGASGAVLGLFGAVAAGIFRLKDRIPPGIRRFELSFMGGVALAQLILDQIIPQVAAIAHIGGILAGFALGMIVGLAKPSKVLVEVEAAAPN